MSRPAKQKHIGYSTERRQNSAWSGVWFQQYHKGFWMWIKNALKPVPNPHPTIPNIPKIWQKKKSRKKRGKYRDHYCRKTLETRHTPLRRISWPIFSNGGNNTRRRRRCRLGIRRRDLSCPQMPGLAAFDTPSPLPRGGKVCHLAPNTYAFFGLSFPYKIPYIYTVGTPSQ